MDDDTVVFTESFAMGKQTLVCTVYENDLCAVFQMIGPRGGLLASMAIPWTLLGSALDAINNDELHEQRILIGN